MYSTLEHNFFTLLHMFSMKKWKSNITEKNTERHFCTDFFL